METILIQGIMLAGKNSVESLTDVKRGPHGQWLQLMQSSMWPQLSQQPLLSPPTGEVQRLQ